MKNQTVKKSAIERKDEILIIFQGVVDIDQDINAGHCCGTTFSLLL